MNNSAFIFDWIIFILGGNNDHNAITDEFEIQPVPLFSYMQKIDTFTTHLINDAYCMYLCRTNVACDGL